MSWAKLVIEFDDPSMPRIYAISFFSLSHSQSKKYDTVLNDSAICLFLFFIFCYIICFRKGFCKFSNDTFNLSQILYTILFFSKIKLPWFLDLGIKYTNSSINLQLSALFVIIHWLQLKRSYQ